MRFCGFAFVTRKGGIGSRNQAPQKKRSWNDQNPSPNAALTAIARRFSIRTNAGFLVDPSRLGIRGDLITGKSNARLFLGGSNPASVRMGSGRDWRSSLSPRLHGMMRAMYQTEDMPKGWVKPMATPTRESLKARVVELR